MEALTRRGALAALAAAVLAVWACGEVAAPIPRQVGISVAPSFGAYAAFADDADRLRISLLRDSAGTFRLQSRVVATIDPVDGTVDTSITVVILQSPTLFRVDIEAIRSSDSTVLFSGSEIVAVSTGITAGPPIEIPVTYTGPEAASLVIAPSDTVVEPGSSFTFRATVRDSAGAAINVPVRFFLVRPADSTLMTVDRLSGAAAVAANADGEVLIFAQTPDTAAVDTARVLIGAVPTAVVADTGYAAVQVGGTVPLTASVVDGSGTPIGTFPVTWVSRSPAVATVTTAGVVTGVAQGTATLVASSPDFPGAAFTDSVLVSVVPAGFVSVSTTSSGLGFRDASVGDTVVVDVAADMAFTPSELLGSYNATLTWDPAVLQYVDVQAGDFPAPELNDTEVATGTLRFAQANAQGTGGAVVVARIRFVALAAGATSPSTSISEMSAAQTFTNLINRVTVANGTVTVR